MTYRDLLKRLKKSIKTRQQNQQIFFNISFDPFSITPKEWTYVQPLLIAVFTLLGLGAFIPSFFSYYQIEKNHFLMKRYFREYIFDYDNIEYIDFEESERKNMVIFYSKTAKMKYLLGDKDGELLNALKKNCKNLYSLEELRRRHPQERI